MGFFRKLIIDGLAAGLVSETPQERKIDEINLRNLDMTSLLIEISKREKELKEASQEAFGSFLGYTIANNKREAYERARNIFKERFQDEIRKEVESILKK